MHCSLLSTNIEMTASAADVNDSSKSVEMKRCPTNPLDTRVLFAYVGKIVKCHLHEYEMKTFPDLPTYLGALKADPGLAIVGTGMAAKALKVQKGAVEQRIARGSLEGVRIGSSIHVRAESATALRRPMPSRA